MIMKTIIQFGDKPNKNGRMYSREIVKGMVNKIRGGSIFVTGRPPKEDYVNMGDVIAYVRDVEYNEENNSIVLEIVPMNKVLELMSNGKDFRNYFRVVPSGIGVVVDGGIIMEYELICFYMVFWEDSPFEWDDVKRHEAIKWNPYNLVVQDHRDGTIYEKETNYVRRKLGIVPFDLSNPESMKVSNDGIVYEGRFGGV